MSVLLLRGKKKATERGKKAVHPSISRRRSEKPKRTQRVGPLLCRFWVGKEKLEKQERRGAHCFCYLHGALEGRGRGGRDFSSFLSPEGKKKKRSNLGKRRGEIPSSW